MRLSLLPVVLLSLTCAITSQAESVSVMQSQTSIDYKSHTQIQLPSLDYLMTGERLWRLSSDDDWEDWDDDSGNYLTRLRDDALYAGVTVIKDWWHVYSSPSRMTLKDGLLVAGFVGAGIGLYTADREVYDAVQRLNDEPWFHPINEFGGFFEPMGNRAFTESWYVSGLIVGYVTGYAPLRDFSADMLESIYLSMVVLTGTKFGSARLRPYQGERTDWFKPKGASFISGHTSNIFQFAGVVSHHFPNTWVRTSAYTIATTVAIERISSTKHWPSDVYFGALWGWFVTEQMFKLKDNRQIQVLPLISEDGRGVLVGAVYTFNLNPS
ncbi:MAG TPA: phosphatase PAP2 family protein [Bacteroidetes bacterium]|nr:PAP2 superfamily protein [bacterium BMS3Bbin04]HDO65888.1 phosphatase PAP2 family protein [Bacteroidota bacterium]HEX05013.1 phosphatase PAP2 family protein [Bacteroidota bacterium]